MPSLGVKWGKESDSLYLQFTDNPVSHSVELTSDVILDLDAGNDVVGIDIQHVSDVLKEYSGINTPKLVLSTKEDMKLQGVPA